MIGSIGSAVYPGYTGGINSIFSTKQTTDTSSPTTPTTPPTPPPTTPTTPPNATQPDVEPVDQLALTLAQIEEKLAPFLTSRGENNPYDPFDIAALETVLESWPDDIPVFDHLTSRELKIAFVNYIISIKDDTNEHEYVPCDDAESSNCFVCYQFCIQTYINLTKNELDISRLSNIYTEPTLPAKYRLPIYTHTCFRDDGEGHCINAILVGDSENNLNDWYFIEPQSDEGFQNLITHPNSYISFHAPITINVTYDDSDDNSIHFYVKPDMEIIRLINSGQGIILTSAVNQDYLEFGTGLLNQTGACYTTDNFKSSLELGVREGLLTMDYLQNAVQAMEPGRRQRELTEFINGLAAQLARETELEEQAQLVAEIEEKLIPFFISRSENSPYDPFDIAALEIVLASWPDNEPLFDHLTTREAKIAFINYVVSVKDDTNELEYISTGEFECDDFSMQAYIRLTNNALDPSILGNLYTGQILTAKYRLPIYILYTNYWNEDPTDSCRTAAHVVNAVLIGADKNDMDDWYFFEPQTDLSYQGIEAVVPPDSLLDFAAPITAVSEADSVIYHYLLPDYSVVWPVGKYQGPILLDARHLDYQTFASQDLDRHEEPYYTTENFKSVFELGIREGLLTMDYLQNAVQAMRPGRRQRSLIRFLDELTAQQTREGQLEEQAQLVTEIEEKLAPFLVSRSENNPYDPFDIAALEIVLESWPDDILLFDHLTTREARMAFVNYVISIKDDSNEHIYISEGDSDTSYVCHDFGIQTYVRLTNNEVNLSHLGEKFSGPTLPAKYRLPIYIFGPLIWSDRGTGGHEMNAVLIGDNKNNLNDWYFIEPQEDRGFDNLESLKSYFDHVFGRTIPDLVLDINAPSFINGNAWDYYDTEGLHFYLRSNLENIGPISRGLAIILFYALNLDYSEFASRILNTNDGHDEGFYTTANFKIVFELGIREGLLDMDYLQNAVQAMREGRRQRALIRFLRTLSSEAVDSAQPGQ